MPWRASEVPRSPASLPPARRDPVASGSVWQPSWRDRGAWEGDEDRSWRRPDEPRRLLCFGLIPFVLVFFHLLLSLVTFLLSYSHLFCLIPIVISLFLHLFLPLCFGLIPFVFVLWNFFVLFPLILFYSTCFLSYSHLFLFLFYLLLSYSHVIDVFVYLCEG